MTQTPIPDEPPHGRLLPLVGALVLIGAIYQTFNLGRWIGYVPQSSEFAYGLLALLMPMAFLLWPRHVWLDRALALASFLGFAWLALMTERIVTEGWEYAAPDAAKAVSLMIWALVLEGARRTGGRPLFVVVALLSAYPIVAGYLPGLLAGFGMAPPETAAFYALSTEGILGVPMRAFVNLVLGFLVFGVALQKTGGGAFFLDLAFAALGHVRGGPAKVAVISSGLMGSMSGSVVSNILTTGTLTIPTMKRIGIRPATAAGIEACASTGGVLAPPIMGATAFVMATFLNIPYQDIALAAVLPTLLYFMALFVQVDAMAAREGFAGIERAQLPRLREVLARGWWYLAVFLLLIWMLLWLNRESWAPWFATALLLAVNQMLPRHRWDRAAAIGALAATGRLFAELASLLAAVGLIVGALVVTGKIGNIASDLLALAGGSLWLLLALGAATAFLLGIGMTVTAAYIFLAVGLAPALIEVGLQPLAVHMFILYWSMLSYITPPVAIGSYAAASIAKAAPMRAGLEAMRLGGVIYMLPFFFVIEPALLFQGPPMQIAAVFGSAVIGVLMIACASQGWMIGLGAYPKGAAGALLRGLTLCGGLALALPGNALTGIAPLALLAAAGALLLPVLIALSLLNRRAT